MINGMLLYKQNGIYFSKIKAILHDRNVVGKFQLLGVSRRTIHRLSTLFSPGKKPPSSSN